MRPKVPKHKRIKEKWRLYPEHLDKVREQSCCVCGVRPVVPHHLESGIPETYKGGMALKTHDKWTVPLCDPHHKELHLKGHWTFVKKYGVDFNNIAKELWIGGENGRN